MRYIFVKSIKIGPLISHIFTITNHWLLIFLKILIYIQIVIRLALIHRLSICIIDLPTTAFNNRFFRHQACCSLLPSRPGWKAVRVMGLARYKVLGTNTPAYRCTGPNFSNPLYVQWSSAGAILLWASPRGPFTPHSWQQTHKHLPNGFQVTILFLKYFPI